MSQRSERVSHHHHQHPQHRLLSTPNHGIFVRSGPNNNGCFARSTREISMYKQHWSTTASAIISFDHTLLASQLHNWFLWTSFELAKSVLCAFVRSWICLLGSGYTHPKIFFPHKMFDFGVLMLFLCVHLKQLAWCQCIIIKCTIAQNVLMFLVWFWYWKNYAQMFYFVIGNMWDRRTTWTKGLHFNAWKCYDLVNCLQLGC